MTDEEDAESMLKKLLHNQLSPSTRFEQVEFQEETEKLQPVGYGSSGLITLSQFLQKQSDQKLHQKETICLHGRLHSSKGAEVTKRKRYGADPTITANPESIEAIVKDHDANKTRLGKITKDLEGYDFRGRNNQPIGHTSRGGRPVSRKALTGLTHEINCLTGLTPEDRARATTDKHNARPTEDVFSERAPQVLDLHSYLSSQRAKTVSPTDAIVDADTIVDVTDTVIDAIDTTVDVAATIVGAIDTSVDVTGCEPRSTIPVAQEQTLCANRLEEIPEEEILRNRLSPDEIQQLPSGKFSTYAPGNPSQVIYIKNLSKDVTEEDLVVLFARYQKSQENPLIFRLMKRGRMKGQAFITFSDMETSSKALQLLNGYILKGKPMVIEFGHHNSSSTVRLSE